MHHLDAEDTAEKAAAMQEGLDLGTSEVDVTDSDLLKKRGHLQVAAGRFENAINEYSLALKIVQCGEEEARLLCNRSAAFASLCQRLRSIPAAQSEAHALYGLDPFTLAQLALKDAQRAVTLQPRWPRAHLQQGSAAFLLERYEEAEAALLEGLSLEPGNAQLQAELQAVRQALDQSGGGHREAVVQQQQLQQQQAPQTNGRLRRVARGDDVECILCMKLLFEPVTTPCGHTFCRACFARTTDHSNKCPMCRTVVHVGRQLPVTVALAAILERSFPEEYEARRAETRTSAAASANGAAAAAAAAEEAPLPLFVMSVMMPGEKMALNIFEPRYRLMVRRCMEGARRFGMATVGPAHELHPIACECEILECQPQPDGRFYLEVVGRRRFSMVRAWEQDGYRVAQPAYFGDDPVPAGTQEAAELRALASSVEATADEWVDRVRLVARGRRGIRVLELLQRAGDKPSASDPEALSFWVANLMPMDAAERLRLLGLKSTTERLSHEAELLARTQAGGTCAVM